MKQKSNLMYHNIITTLTGVVIMVCGLIWGLYRLSEVDIRYYDNQSRILLADEKRTLENSEVYPESEFPYVVFDTVGNVLHVTSDFPVEVLDTVDVQEMVQTDLSSAQKLDGLYKEVILIYKESVLKEFAVFLLPEKYFLRSSVFNQISRCFYPLGISIMIAIILQIYIQIMNNRKMLKPIREICKSANYIIAGNYDYEVLRVNGTKVRGDEVGDLVYSFELMRDELKEKQIKEEQLKKSQQELISCISHDLKTPISTIKAYSEGLRDGIAKTEESKREYEEIIIRKTNLMNQMITELLEYSNAQLNQLDIIKKEVYFHTYFTEVMNELQGYAKQRKTEFTYEEKLDDRIVTIDPKRVTEVLYNLVENSIKYAGGEEGKIQITASESEGEVLIRVLDEGPGINADDIPYVFERFYRAEKSRTSSIPGSGLGLSICKYIIENMGGKIYCRNRKGKGCEIGFTIH